MNEYNDEKKLDILDMAAKIVASYVGANQISPDAIPQLISSVKKALSEEDSNIENLQNHIALKPAINVTQSITDDYIICLEDGKKLKMLKRYLRSNFSMTPEEYRKKWNLPSDYPMVAPNYAQKRSDFAKKIGLGRGVAISILKSSGSA